MAPLFGHDYADTFVEHLQAVYAAYQQSRKLTRRERTTVPRPIAPYSKDLGEVAQKCFDRSTGEPVDATHLQTYRGSQALAQYHLHPEPKFHNANYCDAGVTRRHV